MSRKTKKKETLFTKENLGFAGKILMIISAIYFFSKYRPLIWIILFEVFDVSKTLLKNTLHFIPIDFTFIFGVIVSYYYTPFLGILIFFLSVLNRTVLLCIEPRHVTKCIRHFLLFFLIVLFRGIPFFTAAMLMLTFNYIMKYLLNIARGRLYDFDKAIFHMINFTFATIIFYAVHMLDFYIPFLLS